jgi:hypothetical protein
LRDPLGGILPPQQACNFGLHSPIWDTCGMRRRGSSGADRSEPTPPKTAPPPAPTNVSLTRKLSLAIVLAVVVAQAIVLAPVLQTSHFQNNDFINHYTLARQMAREIEHGGNPLDFWSAELSLGVPMARTYQPLAHLIAVAFYFFLGKTVALATILDFARYLSIIILPLSLYACMLLLEFPPLTAAAGALLLPFVADPQDGMLGLDLRSGISHGVYPQIVATNLLLLAIGLSLRAIRRGKGIVIAGAILGLTCLAHLMYGWMGAVTACLICLIPNHDTPLITRVKRTVALGTVAAVLTAFQLIPLFTDGWLINHSRQEVASKFDSYGAGTVLGWLTTGGLLDSSTRIPLLSVVAAVGIGILLWRVLKLRKIVASDLLVLLGFVLWLLVFFGRTTWGGLLILLGVGADFHLSRVLAIVQLFLVMLAGVGLATVWNATSRALTTIAAVVVTLALLAPLAVERLQWWHAQEAADLTTVAALKSDGADLERALTLTAQRGGRAYAGFPNTYAPNFMLGSAPVYAFMVQRLIPSVSYAYNASTFASDSMVSFTERRPEHYRLFNVRTMLFPPARVDAPFLKRVAGFGRFELYDAPAAGYFGFVDVPAAASVDRLNVYDVNKPWVRGDWPTSDQYILLNFHHEAPPPGLVSITPGSPLPPPPAPGPAAGAVSNERQTGQVYEADLDVARPTYVIFRMSYHPLWKAYLDGASQKTSMLTPGFLGVQVTPGHHHMLCRYEPGNWKPVLAITGLILTIGLIFVERILVRRAFPL